MRKLLLTCARWSGLLAVSLAAAPVHAQSAGMAVPAAVAAPRVREPIGDPARSLLDAERRLAADSNDVNALWMGALALVSQGRRLPLDRKDAGRDSLFTRAERWARRAAALRADDPDVQFALAMAVGNAALTKSARERVTSAEEIYRAGAKAVQLDPGHDGAWHVLGRWHAEMLRVPSVERFFAKQFLGADVFGLADWEKAQAYLERAKLLDSTRITHRLDLAEVYVDRKRWAEARRELDAVRALPYREPNDTLYKQQGEALRRRVRGG
jgi:tetratricopeptide (TPR) repeat protein